MICQKPRETLVVATPLQVTGLAITASTMSHLMQALGAQQQSQNNGGNRGSSGQHGPQSKYERPFHTQPLRALLHYFGLRGCKLQRVGVKSEYLRRL
jgi:hypothetical protein